MQFIALLLRNPERKLHVRELLAGVSSSPALAATVMARGQVREDGEARMTAGFYDGSPILDARAKVEYKRRLDELRSQIEEAQRFNDPDRASQTLKTR